MASKPKERVVVNVIPSSEVMRWLMPDTSKMAIEVRGRKDGSYAIFYPAEGWLPCHATCNMRHKHDRVHPYTESYYHPTDLEDALRYADLLAEGREVKVIEWIPLHQRSKRKKEEYDEAQETT